MERYINPLTDFGFKKLFGTEPNKDLLIDFLNQVLPNRKIAHLSYASNEHFGRTSLDRKAIFDIYCVGTDGEHFIVEMQKAKQNYFKDRSVFYASFPIQQQAQKGDWNYKLPAVYSIGILDFIFEEHQQDNHFLHIIELKNQRGEVFYDKLKFIYLELPKFNKLEHELKTQFDKWMYVLTKLEKLHERPRQLQERIFKKLFQAAEIAQFTPQEQQAYEESIKVYRDIQNIVSTAKMEGLEEGRQVGLKEGMQVGMEEGIEVGKKAGLKQRTLEIARKLKDKGTALADIMDLTGLNKEDIDQL